MTPYSLGWNLFLLARGISNSSNSLRDERPAGAHSIPSRCRSSLTWLFANKSSQAWATLHVKIPCLSSAIAKSLGHTRMVSGVASVPQILRRSAPKRQCTWASSHVRIASTRIVAPRAEAPPPTAMDTTPPRAPNTHALTAVAVAPAGPSCCTATLGRPMCRQHATCLRAGSAT